MTSQHCVMMTQHWAHLSHTLHCRWQRTYSITPNHRIYDVTSTSGMTSYSLYQTSHTLYLCHHNLSTDITPSLVSHQTHYMSDIICTTSDITFHNLGHQVHFMYDIKSAVSDITSIISLSSHPPYWGHHSHYMDGITYGISVKSYPLYIWHNIQ